MKTEEIKKILENINIDSKIKFAFEQAAAAIFELEEGFYYSKCCGITEVRGKYVSPNGRLMSCRVWSISECVNMSYPKWIKDNMKKIDIEKLDKCPLCNGTGRVTVTENIRCLGSSDYSWDQYEKDCIFCKTFNEIKNKNQRRNYESKN